MLRHGLTPIILLLNNNGYTIEKYIHGMHRKYNQIQMWEYSKTLEYYGASRSENQDNLNSMNLVKPSKLGVVGKISTRDEFSAAMKKVKDQKNCLHFLEVIMPQLDAPEELKMQTSLNIKP